MANYNKVILVGRIASDPVEKGENVVSCLAVEDSYGPHGDEKHTNFINVFFIKHAAKFVLNYTSKGSLILVEGKLRMSEYEKNGEKRKSASVIVYTVQGLEKKKADPKPKENDGLDMYDDEIPF